MIWVLWSLYVLATFDGLFSGICAASGRNSLIDKRWYYYRAMWQGTLVAQVASVLGLAIVIGIAVFSSHPWKITDQLFAVATRMVQVYGAYAVVIFVTFAIRAIPSVDIRAATSVVGFGPLTLMRPWVIVAGIGWGLATSPELSVVVAAVIVGAIMIPLRRVLNFWFDFRAGRPRTLS
jgi:hypothetical protein